ncbi:hypothetical protein ASG22_20605 [Chryseobacterium sp. Leaf405]|uniref:DUF2147 domain-containing protein n=1 Tax=Chryseobacterium sp. Leaf405 TaxID=1736367 RepID=UPI0006F56B70|nr:DUF2147 domain-containing protein [Chryseobacterium sp. Leaf405]KQT25305.1 hypothetical protein ASG22_20605 [Chryseobacterium sp. Leaf405]
MRNFFLTIVFLNFSMMLFSQSTADDIIGTWYSPVKEGNVQIYKSGKNYNGKLIYLKHSLDGKGKPILDVNNPDKEKRKRPLVGILLLKDITYDDEKNSWKGKLYDYDGNKGNTYDSYLTITKNGNLNIKGFWGLSFFGLNPGLTLERVDLE